MKWTLMMLACALGPVQGLSAAVIDYVASNEIFPNPERGFYKQYTALFETGQPSPGPLNPASLESLYAQNMSLILRFYVYKSSGTNALTTAQLDLIDQDCAILRSAGLKAVLRFAYTIDPADPDAPLATVLQHIDQLAPVLATNVDVIATVQAGFIGTWGEWHGSSNGLGTTENQRTILEALLAAVPPERAVGVRTPRYKQAIFNRTVPLSGGEAFSGSDASRTGHHNDCFLASDSDFGTYLDPPADKFYLGLETRYVPMGGETCAVNPPRSECPTAIDELEQMHWSYLNSTYHSGVINGWSSGGCLDEIRRRLGHRFRLVRAEVPASVQPGDVLPVELDMANDGFAAAYNPRQLELVLRHDVSGEIYDVTLPDDPRRWLPTTGSFHLMDHCIAIPKDLPEGNYDLLLSLPDPVPASYGQPRFAIRLANSDVLWESSTGYNDLLFQVSVSTNAPTSTNTCSSVLALAPTDAAPTPVTYAAAPVLAAEIPGPVTSTSATLRAHLIEDGGLHTEVSVYWGETDGGTDPAAWAASNSVGTVATGLVTHVADGLVPDTQYAYRFQAVSPAGSGWGPGGTFTTTAPPMVDTDGDGLPDWWETAHFGGPTNAVPFVDTDGDTHSNADEFIALTDPNDPDSRFVIDDISGGPSAQIQYLSASGRVYGLECTADPGVDPPGWQGLGTNQPGTGFPQQFIDSALDPARAYRIRVSVQ